MSELTDESEAYLSDLLRYALDESSEPVARQRFAAIEAAAVRRAAQPGRSASDGVGVLDLLIDILSEGPNGEYAVVDAMERAAKAIGMEWHEAQGRYVTTERTLRSDPLAALATTPPAPDGEREGMKRQEWPEPCCYLNHELEQPCGLPPAEVVFTQTMTGPPTPAAADRPEPHPCFCQHGYGCDSYGRREPVSPDPTPAAAVSVSALVERALLLAVTDYVEHQTANAGASTADIQRAIDHYMRLAAARDTGARGEGCENCTHAVHVGPCLHRRHDWSCPCEGVA